MTMRGLLPRFDLSAVSLVWLGLILAAGAGCNKPPERPHVLLYTSATKEMIEQPLTDFHANTQINMAVHGVAESTDVDGMKKKLQDAHGSPLGDVLWLRDLLPTILLDRQGLFEPYQPSLARGFVRSSSPQHTWHGFSARARVLLVNKEKVATEAIPVSIRDLVDAKWKGRVGLATPLKATSAAHAAALFASWETAQAEEFYRQLKENAQILETEEEVAEQVAAGKLDFALTDSDVGLAQIEMGRPVFIVCPDQEKDGLGTMMIPNTVAILKDCPDPQPARDVVEYLVTPATEQGFASSPAGLAPLSGRSFDNARLPDLGKAAPMRVDYERMGANWEKTEQFLKTEFAAPAK